MTLQSYSFLDHWCAIQRLVNPDNSYACETHVDQRSRDSSSTVPPLFPLVFQHLAVVQQWCDGHADRMELSQAADRRRSRFSLAALLLSPHCPASETMH